MNMTTREMAKFGQLFLQKGLWNGKRVLSSEWIALATSRQTWSGAIAVAGEDGSDWHQGYGFQFWRCKPNCYRADGANGQLTIVMSEYDAVLSVHAGLGDMQKELSLVWKHILPAFHATALPEDAVSAAMLKDRCRTLTIKPLAGGLDGAEKYLGKTYAFESVRHGITSVRLEKSGDNLMAELITAAGTSRFPIGNGTWERGEITIDKGPHDPLGSIIGLQPLKVASSAAMKEDGSLVLHVRFTTGPHNLILTFSEKKGPNGKTASVVANGNLTGIGGVKLVGVASK